ncbi:MAG: hypothetical protein HC822_03110 [Oscillochloris sp.]|nr:hypothetical protein [Oscillochloris sp.]
MLPHTRVRFRLSLALLLIGLMTLGSLPSRPATAQEVGEIQYIDNSQNEFANGVFERTAVGPFVNSAIDLEEEGAVQLAPAGILTRWDTGINTPPDEYAISNGGLVALDRFLYLIAGELNTGKNDQVLRAIVNTTTGRPVPYDTQSGLVWKNYTIPATRGIGTGFTSCFDDVAARSRLGTAALEATGGANLGYIYLVGGVVDLDCVTDQTTPIVQIATVDANGEISAWRSAPFLPTVYTSGELNTEFAEGLADPMVTIVRTSTNRYFLYVIGGFRISPGINRTERIVSTVLYTRLNSETGALQHPTTSSTTEPWARAADIEFFDQNKTGLRDGSAMAAQASKLDNTSNPPIVVSNDAIFVAGGCYTIQGCSDNNGSLLRADITNPDTGELTWDTTPSVNGSSEVGFEGRGGMGGLTYNNKLYLIGGSTDGAPENAKDSVPTAFYDADLNVLRLGDGDTFFIGPDETVLPTGGRSDAAVAMVQATPPEDDPTAANAAWVYVLGGRDASGDNTNSLTIGRIGGEDEASDTRRTRDGWYYSSVESIDRRQNRARLDASLDR